MPKSWNVHISPSNFEGVPTGRGSLYNFPNSTQYFNSIGNRLCNLFNRILLMKIIKQVVINGINIPTRYCHSLPYNALLKDRARKLRCNSTLSEVLFCTLGLVVYRISEDRVRFSMDSVLMNLTDFIVKTFGMK